MASRSAALSAASRIAGALLVAVLLAGLAGVAAGVPGLGLRNWLVVLFEIADGLGGRHIDALGVLNPLDIAALALASVTFAGFSPGIGGRRRVWLGLAVALPAAGIAVLLLTGLWGRSGFMGGGLVLSFLMLGDRGLRPLGYLGIAANTLLLIGDLATTGSPAPAVAAAIGLGYAFCVAWVLWIVARPPARRALAD